MAAEFFAARQYGTGHSFRRRSRRGFHAFPAAFAFFRRRAAGL
jgi:hypothetical protein